MDLMQLRDTLYTLRENQFKVIGELTTLVSELDAVIEQFQAQQEAQTVETEQEPVE